MTKAPGTNRWFTRFARCIAKEYIEEQWTMELDPDLEVELDDRKKDEGWKIYITSSFAKFTCRRCKNLWSSALATMVFHYCLVKKEGFVLLCLCRQKCRECDNPTWHKPQVYSNQIYKVLDELISEILKNCYNVLNLEDKVRYLIHWKTKCHVSSHCEACDLGICIHTQTTPSPGTFPCNRRCKTCRFTSTLGFIQGPKQPFQVRQTFSCTSSNLVYCIRCKRCELLYIGETERRLSDRFDEHLRSVRHNQPDLPVAKHFNSPSHSESDLSVMGLLQCRSEAGRKLKEKRLIFRLGTLHPSGMNLKR
ncbi:receptor-transporting protein 3-like [Rhinoraja longicauda]